MAVVERARIEHIVAQIFEQRTMKRIRPGLGNRVDSSAGAAERRAVRVGLSGKLRNRFNAESCSEHGGAWPVIPEILNVGIVEQECLAFGPGAGDGVIGAPSVKTGRKRRGCLQYAGSQRNQLGVVAAVQWQIGNLFLFHQRCDSRRCRVDLRELAFDGYGLLCLADRQREVDGAFGPDSHGNRALDHPLEAGECDLHFILANQQVRHAIAPHFIRDHRSDHARADVFDLYRRAGKSRAGWIRHCA